MGAAIRLPFRKADEPDADAPELDPEEQIAKVIREHDGNELFVAFTATPAPATVSLFGAPFDSYTEAEAIQESYIVDVAASIISYKTLYNLHCQFRSIARRGGKSLSEGYCFQGAQERGVSG
jgi:type I restriction enzyme R subunit